MAFTKPGHKKRIYIKVTSDFDSTGFMHPKSITWQDGRVFKIDAVKDFRPSSCMDSSLPGDRFTVLIKGEKKHLFFERSDARFPNRIGRWFVEAPHST